MNILVVEDHHALRDMLAAHLRRDGFTVCVAQSGSEALHLLATHTYAAMVLDLGLPDMDGMRVLENSRKSGTPCLILTARDALSSRIEGLNAGADDYILKPFDVNELQARLRAVIRRASGIDRVTLTCGNVTFEPDSKLARVDGQLLDLPRKETRLLEEMLRVAPRIVVKDQLEERLYPMGEAVTLNAIEALVSRLRRKLTHMGATIRIDTVRGVGYRILDHVTRHV